MRDIELVGPSRACTNRKRKMRRRCLRYAESVSALVLVHGGEDDAKKGVLRGQQVADQGRDRTTCVSGRIVLDYVLGLRTQQHV
jgi:hypothetical protein